MSGRLIKMLDRFPPCMCRLVARDRHGRHGLTVRELARRAALSKATISRLSIRRTWAGINVSVIERFAEACGVDLFKLELHLKFLKQRKWVHVATANREQRKMYDRILRGH